MPAACGPAAHRAGRRRLRPPCGLPSGARMLLLLGFAFLAGAGTALSPCVLPVLPAVLSASGAGGRRRPLGVVLGLTVTFTVTIVGIAEVVGGVGLGDGPAARARGRRARRLRDRAAVPGRRGAARGAARRGCRGSGRARGGDGFASGLLVGAALGFVYTPCAGPILAAVITVSAASRAVGRGRRSRTRSGRRPCCSRSASAAGACSTASARPGAGRRPAGMGAVMLATALLIVTNVDVSFDQSSREDPGGQPPASLERSDAVAQRLHEINARKPKFTAPRAGRRARADADGAPAEARRRRPSSRTPSGGSTPPAAGRRRSRRCAAGAVLVDFWTYTCINCLRTLPYLEAWDRRYRAEGLTIVGVHTPEFAFEHDAGNVANAIKRLGIRYPVVQDNDDGHLERLREQVLAGRLPDRLDRPGPLRRDRRGRLRQDRGGDPLGARGGGARRLGADARPQGRRGPSAQTSPETYLGTARAEGWAPASPSRAATTTRAPRASLRSTSSPTAASGRSARRRPPPAPARRSTRGAGKHVYLVLGSAGRKPRQVQVLLDGRPVTPGRPARDVHGGRATVTDQRLYALVSLPRDGRAPPDTALRARDLGFAFTFG